MPHRKNEPSDPRSLGNTPRPLHQVEEPENHGSLNRAELPPVREAILGAARVRELFQDIGACATDIRLISRTRAADSSDDRDQLETVCNRLLTGAVAKVQIRYTWRGRNWIDTLIRNEEDSRIRLVRVAHRV